LTQAELDRIKQLSSDPELIKFCQDNPAKYKKLIQDYEKEYKSVTNCSPEILPNNGKPIIEQIVPNSNKNQDVSGFTNWSSGMVMENSVPVEEHPLRSENIIYKTELSVHITEFFNKRSMYELQNDANLGKFTLGFANLKLPIESELIQFKKEKWQTFKVYKNMKELLSKNSKVEAKHIIFYFLANYDLNKFLNDIKDQNDGLRGEGRIINKHKLIKFKLFELDLYKYTLKMDLNLTANVYDFIETIIH